MKLLDIGAGNKPKREKGYQTVAFDRHDFSKDYKDIDWATFQVGNILEKWPFDDNSFDMIWSHHAFEHLPHQLDDGSDALVHAMNETGRVLKPDAEAHIIVPWIEHPNAWRHPGHYRFFHKELFSWFSYNNKTPDHEAYGYTHKMKLERCWVQDDCHLYAIFKGI